MATFLLFDPTGRMISTTENGADFGAMEPLRIFGKSAEEGWTAIEVHPDVLREIRPSVFRELTGHGVWKSNDRGARPGLQLDPIDTIQRRLTRRSTELVISRLMEIAQELVITRLATQELGFTPQGVDRKISALEKARDEESRELAKWESREFRAPVPKVLVDWAGQTVPL